MFIEQKKCFKYLVIGPGGCTTIQILTIQFPTIQIRTTQILTTQIPTIQIPTIQIPTTQIWTIQIPTTQIWQLNYFNKTIKIYINVTLKNSKRIVILIKCCFFRFEILKFLYKKF